MKIKLRELENRDLHFILSQFIITHSSDFLYKREIKVAEKIIKAIKYK